MSPVLGIGKSHSMALHIISTTFPDKHLYRVGAVPADCVGASHFIKRTIQLFQTSRC